jgi:AmiR/NasT family two-component response regulator
VDIEGGVGPGMSPTRILLAEDEVISRMDLREMLENLGYTVIGEAGDGVAAVNLARTLQPDLVIMDIKMPELDGISAAETLSQERVTPVLLLTAYSDKEFVDRAVDAGVMGYLVKPFAEAQLKPAIEVALERWREVRQIQQDLAQTQETLETRKLVERAKGVLMDSQSLKEAEAFRRIQRLSMNSRKSMREVAEAILLAHEAGRSL